MVPSTWLSTLALIALAVPIVKGQRNTCAADEAGRKGGECIRGQGREFASAFCSSFLPITTPVETSTTTTIGTSTRRLTSFTATTTRTASPPVTTTSSETATFSSTVTETTFNTIVKGTITTFVDTTTTTEVTYTNLFTCPGDTISSSAALTSSSNSRTTSQTLSFPTTSKNATTGGGAGPSGTISIGTGIGTGTGIIGTGTSIIGTGTGIIGTGISSRLPSSGLPPDYNLTRSNKPPYPTSSTLSPSLPPPHYETPDPPAATSGSSYTIPPIDAPTIPPYITATSPPSYYGGKEKRQVFGRPRCLRRLDRTSGLAGISSACECLDIATPSTSTAVSTVPNPTSTVTRTTTVRRVSTSITTPTTTATQSVNRTQIFTDFVTSTTEVDTTVPATLIITRTSVSTIVGPSPTPSTFNIYYTLNSTTPANFFQAGPAPGGSGIILASEAQADFFSIDGMSRLVDVTAGNLFMAKNTQDLYPFTLLQTNAETANVPLCEACGGVLQCDYPDTTGNVFGLCYGFLALGPRSIFGKDADGGGEVDCTIVEMRYK